MILAGNQPYFLPYLGYWQLINAADVFLIADDYNYIKRGWIARNQILLNNKPKLFSLDIKHKSSFRKINDIELSEDQKSKHRLLNQIDYEYHRAPFFLDGYSLLEDIVSCSEENLAVFLENSIRSICAYLDIMTPIRRTSELLSHDNSNKQERIFNYCKQLEADTYINLIGGTKLYNPLEFAEHGITLKFLKSDLPPYKQYNDEFVPGLSILDAIMFCSKEQLQEMLDAYSLV